MIVVGERCSRGRFRLLLNTFPLGKVELMEFVKVAYHNHGLLFIRIIGGNG